MESVENTANSPETVKPAEDTKPKKEKRNRVARCMVCSEEWMAKNGNEKKPSRCPTCKSYNVKWRDECDDPTPGAGTPAKPEEKKRYARKRNPDGSFAKSPKNETEVKEISETESHENEETDEKPKIPPPEYNPEDTAFKQPPKQQEPDEQQPPEEMPKFPNIHPIGLILVIGFIGLVGAVVMFFLKNKGLPQPQKTQTPAPAARPRNPTLEAALKRMNTRGV